MALTAAIVAMAAILAWRHTERAFPFESMLAFGLTGILLFAFFKAGDLW